MQIREFSAGLLREHGHHVDRLQRSIAAKERVEALAAELERKQLIGRASKLRDQIVAFRTHIEKIHPLQRSSSSYGAAIGNPVSFDTSTRAATLSSTEEINTDATAYYPEAPAWDGLSTSQALVTGTYDGSLGTTTLTATVTRSGIRTVSNARVEIEDDNSGWDDRFNINGGHSLDRVYGTDIGLDFTFGLGAFIDGDTFTIELQTGLQVRPDPDGAFDASDGTDANLEATRSVTAGTFTVNGEVITVDADDSINGVLAKINASSAGVTAVYNATDETIELTQDTVGAAPTIDLANDTSGFLAAMKLDAASVVPGKDSDLDRPIGELAPLSGVVSGSILINGLPVVIDTSTDSILAIIDSINLANVGANASLTNQTTLSFQSTSQNLALDSNGTSFFEAFGITSGTFGGDPSWAQNRASDVSLYRISRSANALVRGLNRFFNPPGAVGLSEEMSALRDELGGFFADGLTKPLQGLSLRPGVGYAPDNPRNEAFRAINEFELRRGFRWQFNAVQRVFIGTPGQKGVLDELIRVLDEKILTAQPAGSVVDEVV